MPEPLRLLIDRSYRRPEGTDDLPYVQVFDAYSAGVPEGPEALRVPLPLPRDGSVFVLRAVRGRERVCSRIQLRFGEQTVCSHDRGFVMPPCWVVLPERELRDADMVNADMYDVAFASRSSVPGGTVYSAFMTFQGVRRVAAIHGETPCVYDRFDLSAAMPWTHSTDVTVSWPHTDRRARDVYVEIRQFAFVWYALSIVRMDNYAPPSAEVAVLPYDYRMVQLASDPVLDLHVNRLAAGGSREYFSCFPVPALKYPVGSVLRFDVRSLLLSDELPRTYRFYFHGLRLRR